MILFPNAKINLGLNILRRRDDGYHDIETVMIPVPWCDILEIVPARGESTTLTVTGRRVDCPPEKNLVMKAYKMLQQEVSLPPVDIYLRKIIPDGAGLGGGSADAAFTIIGLNRLFGLGYSQEDMARMASSIGADCPFFIYNRPMLCTGTGTELTPIDIDMSGLHILLAKPHVNVPTVAAYAHTIPAVPAVSTRDIVLTDHHTWQGVLKNDFEQSVFPSYPTIADVKRRIMSLNPVYAAMSGSGACVYGLFDSDILSPSVMKLFADCDTYVTKL